MSALNCLGLRLSQGAAAIRIWALHRPSVFVVHNEEVFVRHTFSCGRYPLFHWCSTGLQVYDLK